MTVRACCLFSVLLIATVLITIVENRIVDTQPVKIGQKFFWLKIGTIRKIGIFDKNKGDHRDEHGRKPHFRRSKR